MGLDSITDMLKFLLVPVGALLTDSTFELWSSDEFSLSASNADGRETFAGCTALTLFMQSEKPQITSHNNEF